jgi:hypothetical protein
MGRKKENQKTTAGSAAKIFPSGFANFINYKSR